ncbi:MAG: integrase core domain-containing protein [Candidatus Kariarchaeaceae archaeon]|jgi:transposase InsO family protein
MRLAHIGKRLGRKVLDDACCVFSPDTIIKWHRYLIARKYDGSRYRKAGRRRISEELENLIIQIALKNKAWGTRRIKGQLKYVGYNISHTTIGEVLKRNGINPSPYRKRKTRWNEFLKSHWDSLAAIDFFTTEIYTLSGLTRYMVLVTIDYATRKVQVMGVIQKASGEWMKQVAKNMTDPVSGFLRNKKFLIHDRDTLFTKEFQNILRSSGVEPIRTLPMSPNLNPIAERFVLSIKSECLNRMLIFGERHLKYLIEEYVEHYHTERSHQGIDYEIIEPPPQGKGEIVCQERIGGLLTFYERAA